jgi:hypothetical protein
MASQGISLLLTILSIFVYPWVTFAFCVIPPLFLSRSNEMATNIGFLAPGHNGHALEIEIGLKGLPKSKGNPRNFFFIALPSALHGGAKATYATLRGFA